MSRFGSRARALLATSIVAIVAGSLACEGGAVIIGIQSAAIESDGGVRESETDAASSVHLALPDANPVEIQAANDAGFFGCLPDGGCPYGGETCEYPVDAGCGAEGQCVGEPPPLPPAPPPGGYLSLRHVGGATSDLAGYTPIPPGACDAGESNDADASDRQDARGD